MYTEMLEIKYLNVFLLPHSNGIFLTDIFKDYSEYKKLSILLPQEKNSFNIYTSRWLR